jgi:hypothetical protein
MFLEDENVPLVLGGLMLQMVVAVLTNVRAIRVLSRDTTVLHHPLNHQIIN